MVLVLAALPALAGCGGEGSTAQGEPRGGDGAAADRRRGRPRPGSQGNGWPLPAGDYAIPYLLAGQYESAGSAELRVRGGG